MRRWHPQTNPVAGDTVLQKGTQGPNPLDDDPFMQPLRRIQEHRTAPRPPPKMACNPHHSSKQMRPRPTNPKKQFPPKLQLQLSEPRLRLAAHHPQERQTQWSCHPSGYRAAHPRLPGSGAGHADDLGGRMFRPSSHNRKGQESRRHMDLDAIDRILRKHAAAIGLTRGYSPHSMRATFITTAVENGATLDDVQRAAGLSQAQLHQALRSPRL